MNGKTIGYARTSNEYEDISSQVAALESAGCSRVYTDLGPSESGLDRPGLKEARDSLQAGDKFKVVRVDRIARSADDLKAFAGDLLQNHIQLESLNEPDAATVLHFHDAMNYKTAMPEMPLWRRIAGRLGAYLIGLSEGRALFRR